MKIWKLASHTGSSPYKRFGSLVRQVRERESGEDVDRVFALLSLCPPDLDFWVKPDYTKSMTQVFIEHALEFLRQAMPKS